MSEVSATIKYNKKIIGILGKIHEQFMFGLTQKERRKLTQHHLDASGTYQLATYTSINRSDEYNEVMGYVKTIVAPPESSQVALNAWQFFGTELNKMTVSGKCTIKLTLKLTDYEALIAWLNKNNLPPETSKRLRGMAPGVIILDDYAFHKETTV